MANYDDAARDCEINDLKEKLENARQEIVRLQAKCGVLAAKCDALANASKELALAVSYGIDI